MANKTNNYNYPDKNGRFGSFGGRYVSETLISALEELESLYKIKNDKKFQEELANDLQTFVEDLRLYFQRDGPINSMEPKFSLRKI